MNLIFGKEPLDASKSETIDLICCKTGLKSNYVVLLLDAFSFFLRKRVIETGGYYIRGLGVFYVKPNSSRLYGHKHHKVIFTPCDDFKERIKGTKDSPIKHCSLLQTEIKAISCMFGLKILDVKYLHKLFIYCIIIYSKKYRIYRIPRVGNLKLSEFEFYKHSTIAKQWNTKNINITRVNFLMSDYFFRELNKKTSQYFMYDRLSQMLTLSDMSRNITRKEYTENYDYKEAKRATRRY
jgi:hypothetical protein